MSKTLARIPRLSRYRYRLKALCSLLVIGSTMSSLAFADEPTKEGAWITQRDEASGTNVLTMEMTLHPKEEPRPALKHRFIPDEFDLVEGNAAIFYLKAMGFLEQNAARDMLSEAYKKAAKLANEKETDVGNVPPYTWLDMAPKDLPIEQVKQHLMLTSFQPRDLAEATRRRSYSANRNLRDEENPIGVLLPDIQTMRELARTQSIRCKLAIAEGRIDDAIAILGQQFAMAKHLGTDEFLVSNLVGCAVAGIAWGDALFLVQHPETPNLYWSFAALPNPLVDMRLSMSYERQFLYHQVKMLREVDETPRNAGYWSDFIDRIFPQLKTLGMEGLPTDPELQRPAFVALIAAAYPGAKQFLLQEVGMDRAKVDSFPTAQVVFLAVRRFYDLAADDQLKWNLIPMAQANSNPLFRKSDERLREWSAKIGLVSAPVNMLLPALTQVKNAQQRNQMTIAMLQTVESIRQYGAANEGKLPVNLESLTLPAPVDPFTGKSVAYELIGDHAVLTGTRLPGLQYRLVLRFAKATK